MPFKILKISHGTNFFNYENHLLMIEKNLASVHIDTSAKGLTNQNHRFRESRDLLLPRLMMGLADAEEILKE